MRYPEPDGSADDITHSSAHRRTDGIANGCSYSEADLFAYRCTYCIAYCIAYSGAHGCTD